MSKVIYVVYGDYAGKREWDIAIYDNLEQAKEHARLATEAAQTYQAQNEDRLLIKPELNPYDPYTRMDFPGITYAVTRMPLFSTVTQFLKK